MSLTRPLAWHRHPAFLRHYERLPDRWLNRSIARFTRARHPAWAVRAAIRVWSRLANIELGDFEEREYASVDDFFLRELRPGARPLGDGFVSPADGILVGSGSLRRDTVIEVKGHATSIERIVNGGGAHVDLGPYAGGRYAVIFLTPRGYHHVHMPATGTLRDVSWIPGRFFPQNETALAHIPRVYERNERAVLRVRRENGGEFLLVLVGASLIGGIHLEAMPRAQWAMRSSVPVERTYEKGEKIGHFAFGSTVVILLPPGALSCHQRADEVRMGESLFTP